MDKAAAGDISESDDGEAGGLQENASEDTLPSTGGLKRKHPSSPPDSSVEEISDADNGFAEGPAHNASAPSSRGQARTPSEDGLPGQSLGEGSSELAVSYADDPGSEELDAAAIAKALRRPEETEGESERSSEGDVQAMGMDFLSRERERLDEARDKLFRAAGSGSLRDLKAAVRAGASVNTHDPSMCGWTPLHYVAEKGSTSCLRYLLDLSANVSSRSIFGHTPLHVAVLEGHEDVVDDLLEAGAPANARTQSDYTPLHVAAGQGHLHLLRRLHAAGANASGETWVQNTGMHLAATQGHTHVVRGLLQLRLNPDHQNEHGNTPLHHACMQDRAETAVCLLQAGANPNITNEDGRTALHEAGVRGFIETLEAMLESGGAHFDFWVEDKDNCTAFEASRRAGHGLCATVLWRIMGKPGGRLHVPPAPKTKEQELDEFVQLFWETYQAHRTEPFLDGVTRASNMSDFTKAVAKVRGWVEPELKEEDKFVVRKGLRVYLNDKEKGKPKALKYPRKE